MISPADWQRMSWYARDKFIKRHGRPTFTEGTKLNQREALTLHVVEDFSREPMARCGLCGAWMLETCTTDHGKRYES